MSACYFCQKPNSSKQKISYLSFKACILNKDVNALAPVFNYFLTLSLKKISLLKPKEINLYGLLYSIITVSQVMDQ